MMVMNVQPEPGIEQTRRQRPWCRICGRDLQRNAGRPAADDPSVCYWCEKRQRAAVAVALGGVNLVKLARNASAAP